MTTAELFGVSDGVAKELYKMSHVEFLRIGIALMNKVQEEIVDSYLSEEFKSRAKAIKNYEKWLKDNGYGSNSGKS